MKCCKHGTSLVMAGFEGNKTCGFVLCVLILLGSLSACNNVQKKQSKKDNALSQEEVPIRMSRSLMGTVFQISAWGADKKLATKAIEEAFKEIERLEAVLSEWKETSEVSKINQRAGIKKTEVSSDTLAVIQAGLNVSKWSAGAYDLSWAVLHGAYDFRPGHLRIPNEKELSQKLPLVRWEDVYVDEQKNEVKLKQKGMKIGTGSIGKGYALDRASEVLKKNGVERFMIFGGGQVQVRGDRGSRPWRIGIQHPRVATGTNAYFAFLEVDEGSVSTSGDYEHAWIDEQGKRWHHILDLKTGLPSKKSVSVTVVSESGIYADALSTAVFVLGPEKAEKMFKLLPIQADFLWIGPECQMYQTPGLSGKIKFRMELKEGKLPGCNSD